MNPSQQQQPVDVQMQQTYAQPQQTDAYPPAQQPIVYPSPTQQFPAQQHPQPPFGYPNQPPQQPYYQQPAYAGYPPQGLQPGMYPPQPQFYPQQPMFASTKALPPKRHWISSVFLIMAIIGAIINAVSSPFKDKISMWRRIVGSLLAILNGFYAGYCFIQGRRGKLKEIKPWREFFIILLINTVFFFITAKYEFIITQQHYQH